jgi:hypothetical protein
MAVLSGIIDTTNAPEDALTLPLPVDSILAVQNNGPGGMFVSIGSDRFFLSPNNTSVVSVPKGVIVTRDRIKDGPDVTGSFQLVVPG